MMSMFLAQIATVVVIAGNGPVEAARPAVNPFAQPQAAHPRIAQRAQGKNAAAKRQKIMRRIRSLRAWRLTEALDLDTKTAARLFPLLNSYDGKFAKVARQAGAVRRQMRSAMKASKPNSAQLNRLINQMVKLQRANWALQEARFRAVRKVLSPTQAAKILIILPQIDQRIRRQIRRAMRSRRGRGVKNPFRGGKTRPRRRPGKRGPYRDPF
jgi:hypothetical protein